MFHLQKEKQLHPAYWQNALPHAPCGLMEKFYLRALQTERRLSIRLSVYRLAVLFDQIRRAIYQKPNENQEALDLVPTRGKHPNIVPLSVSTAAIFYFFL